VISRRHVKNLIKVASGRGTLRRKKQIPVKCSLNSTLTMAEDIEKRGKELKKMGERKKKKA
jgi:hypothetical protein